MWLVNLVSVAVAASFFAASCQSASVPETAVETRTARLGGDLNKYYITTLQHIIDRTEMELVANDATAIGALTLTGTENVAIVVHGRESGAHSEFGYTLRDSIIAKDNQMVIILVDWTIVSYLNYDQAVNLVPSVAEDLIAFITQMVASTKLNTNLLHLIGFDLGAHIVGIASRNTNVQAMKITALSPAGDRWDMYSQRLRANDARFVEVIHTDAVGARAFGVTDAIGGLDFFANGGTRQPGCATSDNWCHHNRAWQLFAATVDRGVGHLEGQRCDSMTQVNNNRCIGPSVSMGTLELIKIQFGIYRVNTGRVYPFST